VSVKKFITIIIITIILDIPVSAWSNCLFKALPSRLRQLGL
jgi:hypothetical protein